MDCDIVLLRTLIKQGINIVTFTLTYFIDIPWLIARKLSKQKENVSHRDHNWKKYLPHTYKSIRSLKNSITLKLESRPKVELRHS